MACKFKVLFNKRKILIGSVSVASSFPWIEGCKVLKTGVILVVVGHGIWYLHDGSLREMNVPLV